MSINISKLTLESKSRKIDEIRSILKKQKTDFELLSVVLEQLEEIQSTVQNIVTSFSVLSPNLDFKKLLTTAHQEIVAEITDFDKTKEEVEELLAYLDKKMEIDVVIGAFEIITRDTKDSELAKNLENLIFQLKEYGTTDDPMTLLSRASWKW